ncbi:MAG: hypothetical protein LIO56_03480 [Lachnospiraceae bacterium]|nr:hypothetical protein [Lachnospiraceae bacterium]
MNAMTPKERMLAFFHHQPTDELPSDDGLFILFDAETYAERPPHETGGTDWWGVEWKYEPTINAISPDHSKPPVMEDICDWREVLQFPDLDAWDWSRVEEIDHISEIDRANKVFEMMFLNGPFERMHMLMGFENALVALLAEPEEVEAYLDVYMDWKIHLMEKVIEIYRPDVLMFHDDWGTQNNMFFSPDLWREMFKPQIQKAVDRCHELGVIFEMHSDGMIEDIVPDFVEMGIDSWQGQEINDVAKLKEITGDRLSYHTTPDYQKYYAQSLSVGITEEEVRSEVRKTLYRNAKDYCYCPMFLPFGGWTTEVMIDEVNKCGKTIYQN